MKYYTPEIEEFHVGFEYECESTRYPDKNNWHPEVFYMNNSHIDMIGSHLGKKNVRVKYLDKEDIESLGFKELGHNGWISDDQIRIKHLFGDVYDILDYGLKVKGESPLQYLKFSGIIKNKSELVKLLKQIKT